jgi:hypothetical protein
MAITPTIHEDLPQIEEWIKADPWHKEDSRHTAEFLLTGGGLLAFCLLDEKGPLCFVRLDAEEDMVRLSTQFGPEQEVSKKRLVVGMLSEGIPAIKNFARNKGYKGIVFESTSETLINFMNQQGFFKVEGDDYALTFGETHV